MRATRASLMLAACLVLGVASVQSVYSSEDADIVIVDPVPSRQLLAEEGSPGGYGDYGDYGDYGGYGSRRRLAEGGYGYGDYGDYGDYGHRRLSEEVVLEPEDALLPSQQQHHSQQQQAESGPSAIISAAVKAAHSTSQETPVPLGKCYCQFDPDFNTFAIGEDRCKQALYQKCKSKRNNLQCAWLDGYYQGGMKPGFLAHELPHERDIQAFLFEDCTPAPPCACKALRFDGSDDEFAALACCRDLKTSCKAAFSGMDCPTVAGFCHEEKGSYAKVATWSSHALRYADCSAYKGLLYEYMSLEDMVGLTKSSSAPKPEHLISSPAELLNLMAAEEGVTGAAASSPRFAVPELGSSFRGLLVVLGAAMAATAVVGAAVTIINSLARGGSSSSEGGVDAPLLPKPSAAVAAMSRSASMLSNASAGSEPLLPKRSTGLRPAASSNTLVSTPRAPSRNPSWASLDSNSNQ